MRVIATAGHVDHGKSTLVRALTGADPDRWEEEHRRGLTIDLGYVWTTFDVPSGVSGSNTVPTEVAFVDVPGHEHFIANTLAGLGPAPAVLLVVAADEGWRRQSAEHLDALRALGVERGVVALTRAELAAATPGRLEATTEQVRAELAGTGLADAPIAPVSAVTGQGMDTLREQIALLCAALPDPDAGADVRLWIDRAFSIRGAGTVVTGTLEAGTLRVGEEVELDVERPRTATIRGLQSLETPREEVAAPARVAVNLRGVPSEDLHRGDLLLTGGPWHRTVAVDARLLTWRELTPAELPEHLMAHLGSQAFQVRVRPLAEDALRLTWERPLPLRAGDRLLLRDPGRREIVGAGLVLDADPPRLERRGAARRRGDELAGADARLDVVAEVSRRGFAQVAELRALGADDAALAEAQASRGVRAIGPVLVAVGRWEEWVRALRTEAEHAIAADPLQARLAIPAAARALGLPAGARVEDLAQAAGLEAEGGWLRVPGLRASLGQAEAGLLRIEQRLTAAPFDAPERDELTAAGLGPRQIAAAVELGRLLDLGDLVVVLPTAPALAMRTLAGLPQPFTTSQARQALGTTRRVVIPLLEHLDGRRWTRRLDAGHREVVR